MSGTSQYGPNPWQQTSWDWRAAGNYICGGAGTGLLIASALIGTPAPASLSSPDWLVFAGLALVGLGLLCVWLEIGRPLRALNVFINPWTSWMSREAIISVVLFPAGLAAMLGFAGWLWVTAALALGFLYCQSRMLPAARGIPAWRSGWVSPLFLLTAACEGCGMFLVLGFLHGRVSDAVLTPFLILLALRLLVWQFYRKSINTTLAVLARRVLDRAFAHLAIVGTGMPMLLVAILGRPGSPAYALPTALAGACAAWAGGYIKYTLVTRAAYNQGFALFRMPVRGVRDKP